MKATQTTCHVVLSVSVPPFALGMRATRLLPAWRAETALADDALVMSQSINGVDYLPLQNNDHPDGLDNCIAYPTQIVR